MQKRENRTGRNDISLFVEGQAGHLHRFIADRNEGQLALDNIIVIGRLDFCFEHVLAFFGYLGFV